MPLTKHYELRYKQKLASTNAKHGRKRHKQTESKNPKTSTTNQETKNKSLPQWNFIVRHYLYKTSRPKKSSSHNETAPQTHQLSLNLKSENSRVEHQTGRKRHKQQESKDRRPEHPTNKQAEKAQTKGKQRPKTSTTNQKTEKQKQNKNKQSQNRPHEKNATKHTTPTVSARYSR